MGVFKDLIFSLKLSMVVTSHCEPVNPLLLGHEAVEWIGLGLHPGRGLIDDLVDGVETVVLRPNILSIWSSQYVVLAEDFAKDKLMQLAEHIDFNLVKRTQMHIVLLEGGTELGWSGNLRQKCWFVG